MMKLSKALMLSVSGLIIMSGDSLASIHNLTSFNSPGAVTFVHTPYTHTSHPEEVLLSSAFYPLPKDLGRGWGGFHNTTLIQLAATCFVTDTSACSGNEFSGNNADDDGHGAPGGPGDGDDYDLDNAERCHQEGYTQTSCPEGQEGSNFCPYDNDYFEKCVNSCPSNYVTCEKPYYGVGEACDGKYASCECTPCGSGYDNTTIPEGYVQDGEACLDCDGKTKYKIKPNPCDGYMNCGSMGGEAGAKTCLSGTTTMYDNCKACPNLGEYTTCPNCTICQYEECSGLWYATGCATNCTNYCNPPTTDCQALGYKRDTCSGRSLKCPYDSAYVLCL